MERQYIVFIQYTKVQKFGKLRPFLITFWASEVLVYNRFEWASVLAVRQVDVLSECRLSHSVLRTCDRYSKKQIKKIILKEGMYLSVIAIHLGLVAGYIISEVISKYLLLSDVSVSKWLTALAIGLISIITVYVSLIKPMKVASKVSIVEAVKYNGESTTKKKTRKGYDYINVSRLTKANLSCNKKRTYVNSYHLH